MDRFWWCYAILYKPMLHFPLRILSQEIGKFSPNLAIILGFPHIADFPNRNMTLGQMILFLKSLVATVQVWILSFSSNLTKQKKCWKLISRGILEMDAKAGRECVKFVRSLEQFIRIVSMYLSSQNNFWNRIGFFNFFLEVSQIKFIRTIGILNWKNNNWDLEACRKS